MVEAGAAEVHISYRHDTPRFAPSDWSWVDAIVDHIGRSPGWFGRLSQDEREGVQQRFWAEGRLKLEPWLEPRLRRENITLWPSTAVVQAVELCSGEVCVKLDTGAQLRVDHLVLATGYKVVLSRLPYLSRDSVLPALNVADGYPVLNEGFESSLPGLFFTGPSAVRDLGPFFGFVVGCPAAARVIVDRVNIRHSRGVASG